MMDDSSRFLRQLQREQNKLDKLYRNSFIDYERLRKQIKKIVYYEQANHDPTVNHQASNPLAVNNPVESSNNSRVSRSHQQFWQLMESDLDKLNQFFLSKDESCNQLFDELGLDCVELLDQPVHPLTTVTFAKVLIDTFPAHAGAVLEPAIHQTAAQVNLNELNPPQVALFQRFLSLCFELDQLRKFLVLNYIILWKTVKKYDKHTRSNSTEQFLQQLNNEAFASNKIASLLSRAHTITDRLLNKQFQADKAKGNNVACPICLNPLERPLQLSCEHSFCFDCVTKQPCFGTSCPLCKKEQQIAFNNLTIDSILSRFTQINLNETQSQPIVNDLSLEDQNSMDRAFSSLSNTFLAPNTPNVGNLNNLILRMTSSNANVGVATSGPNASPDNAVAAAASVSPTAFLNIDRLSSFNSQAALNLQDESEYQLADGVTPHQSAMFLQHFFSNSGFKPKRGQGVSCHQCKTTKDPQFLLFCTNKAEKNVRKRRCRKKYCESCLKRSYSKAVAEAMKIDPVNWRCPSCLSLCLCAACQRRGPGEEGDDADCCTAGENESGESNSSVSDQKSFADCNAEKQQSIIQNVLAYGQALAKMEEAAAANTGTNPQNSNPLSSPTSTVAMSGEAQVSPDDSLMSNNDLAAVQPIVKLELEEAQQAQWESPQLKSSSLLRLVQKAVPATATGVPNHLNFAPILSGVAATANANNFSTFSTPNSPLSPLNTTPNTPSESPAHSPRRLSRVINNSTTAAAGNNSAASRSVPARSRTIRGGSLDNSMATARASPQLKQSSRSSQATVRKFDESSTAGSLLPDLNGFVVNAATLEALQKMQTLAKLNQLGILNTANLFNKDGQLDLNLLNGLSNLGANLMDSPEEFSPRKAEETVDNNLLALYIKSQLGNNNPKQTNNNMQQQLRYQILQKQAEQNKFQQPTQRGNKTNSSIPQNHSFNQLNSLERNNSNNNGMSKARSNSTPSMQELEKQQSKHNSNTNINSNNTNNNMHFSNDYNSSNDLNLSGLDSYTNINIDALNNNNDLLLRNISAASFSFDSLPLPGSLISFDTANNLISRNEDLFSNPHSNLRLTSAMNENTFRLTSAAADQYLKDIVDHGNGNNSIMQ
jgi:hypothetical protein